MPADLASPLGGTDSASALYDGGSDGSLPPPAHYRCAGGTGAGAASLAALARTHTA